MTFAHAVCSTVFGFVSIGAWVVLELSVLRVDHLDVVGLRERSRMKACEGRAGNDDRRNICAKRCS